MGTFQVYIFKRVQILAYFFTLNISTCTNFVFASKWGSGARPPKYAPVNKGVVSIYVVWRTS